MSETCQSPLRNISGVPLCTKSGEPRSRFSPDEKVCMLGCGTEDLEYFDGLFAPRHGKHIVRRIRDGRDSDWKTIHHSLRGEELMYHLLGDRLPGREPLWVGVFGWDSSRWMAIDVDHQGDDGEFDGRCRFIERQLLVLGIPMKSLLVLPTPSGGRHYYFFFYGRECLVRFRMTLANVGIDHRPGQFEIYPDPNHGFRLPFGHVPHDPPDPTDWIRFLQQYRAGQFPRVSSQRCRRRAEAFAAKHGTGVFGNYDVFAETEMSRNLAGPLLAKRASDLHGRLSVGIGQERQDGQHPFHGRERLRRGHDGRARPGCMAGGPVTSTTEVHAIIDRGITGPGTRVELTKRVAWHFVFAKGLDAEETKRLCVDWVYRTGRKTSKDVEVDLARGTRRVEQQTHKIVGWMIAHRKRSAGSSRTTAKNVGFASEELSHLVSHLIRLPKTKQLNCGRFALEFLRFSKGYGRPVERGWEASPSVRGIMRKWPRCSGTRYLPKRTGLETVGLLVKTKEKLQLPGGRGRARTYRLNIPLVRPADCLLSFDQALADLRSQLDVADTDGDFGE